LKTLAYAASLLLFLGSDCNKAATAASKSLEGIPSASQSVTLIAQNRDRFTIAFGNQCSSTSFDLAINYKDIDGQWKTSAWYNFKPGERSRLNVQTANSIFYYYARATDGSGRYWGGSDFSLAVSGQTFGAKQVNMGSSFVDYTQNLSCAGETSPYLQPPATSEARGENYEDIGGGWAGGKAVLYRNGSLIVTGRAVSNANNSATYAGIYVVGVDSRGRALFVSDFFRLPTACGRWDPTCSSDTGGSYSMNLSPAIAQYVNRLDVIVSGRDQPSSWQRWRSNIQEAVKTYNDLPPEVKAAMAAAAAGG
jgi:hypothetical protein